MDYDGHFFVLDNRLASFQIPQSLSNHRQSTAASKNVASWPHSSPAPEDLARAGFFFNPHPANPDNVRCFLCHRDLDGWEEEDDPLQEHLKHSPSCGWAICAAIELELGEVVNEDPRLSYLLDARKATFGGLWPYESKKGWKCKTKQLADAGWKYTPTLESDDNTTCTYCQLALDGWESGDKPLEEHQRRSPNCPFFILTRNPLKKKPRARAARTSKASSARLSIQSVAESVADVTSDFQSLADPDESILTTTTTATTAQGRKKQPRAKAARTSKASNARLSVQSVAESLADVTSDFQSLADPDESILTTTTTATTTQGRKTATASASRARKSVTGAAAKGRKAGTKDNDPIVIEDSILEEPAAEPDLDVAATSEFVEDASIMEVPAPAPTKAPTKPARGKKRASEQAQSAQPPRVKRRTSEEDEPLDSADAEIAAPAAKKRATRVRASSSSIAAHAPNNPKNDFAMFNPAPPDVDEADIEAELRELEQDMEVDQQVEDQVQHQLQQEEQEQKIQVSKKGRKATGTRKVSKQTTRKAKETAPTEEIVQPEPGPEQPAPIPAQTKPKARGRPKKVSQQPQPPPPPPPPDHDMEEGEPHEDSIISFMSTDTVARESEQLATSKQKSKSKTPKTVTAVPIPVPAAAAAAAPAPPAVPSHAPQPLAETAPPKRGRGRPPKASIDSVQSSIGNTSQASVTSTGSFVPAKITHIPPPSFPGAAATASEAAAPKAAVRAPVEKRTKAPAPLPKKRLSLMDIEEREMREQQARKQVLEEKARKLESQRQEALRQEELRQEELRQEKLRQEELRQEALRQEALRQEALRQEALRQEEEALREEALMEEQLQREQLEKEQQEREQRKKQQSKKQQPKKPSAQQSRDEQEPRLAAAPETPRKASLVASAKQATISPSPSLQSSDAENQPPSSRQAAKEKTMMQVSHVPIPSFPAPPARDGNVTPVRESPSKHNINGNTLGGLRATLSWTAVNVDAVFELGKESGGGENGEKDILEGLLRKGTELTTPERAMSVEEFILHNAGQAEQLLKEDCEAMVSEFEQYGSRAMRVLESLEVVE